MKNSSWTKRPLFLLSAAAGIISALGFLLTFVGCGSTTDGKPLYSGLFLDAAVEGMEFHSGKRIGITDEEGKFYFKEDETVYFYVGGAAHRADRFTSGHHHTR